MKLIDDAATDKVLGAHMIGEAAAEIIQSVAIALTMGATRRILTAPSRCTPAPPKNW